MESMCITMNDVKKIKNNKLNIINEFILAKDSGFIEKISMKLDDHTQVYFDPDTITFKQETVENFQIVSKNKIENSDELPNYRSLHIKFVDNIDLDILKDVGEHCMSTYNCTYSIYKSKNLVLKEFK